MNGSAAYYIEAESFITNIMWEKAQEYIFCRSCSFQLRFFLYQWNLIASVVFERWIEFEINRVLVSDGVWRLVDYLIPELEPVRTKSSSGRMKPDFCRFVVSLTSKMNRTNFNRTGPDKFRIRPDRTGWKKPVRFQLCLIQIEYKFISI
jgi:hypothetical protein